MKKILFFLLIFLDIGLVFAGSEPELIGAGLPGSGLPGSGGGGGRDVINTYIPRTIATLIKYTAVIAVIAIIISGIMYILSFGQEDKAKKAKNGIIYSLVGVLISISAYAIISLVNSISLK